MVELGRRQAVENRRFAEESTAVATDLVVVGRTNRRALVKGAGGVDLRTFRTREQAVHWVRATLGPGDAVLYENDLPDHYP
jgi:UDP-N-acetylmuramoyl-tripeptide--D-alanyl-D-alanine ligase